MTDEAFAELVRTTSARLYRLALRMTGSPAEAEDILQETYLRAHVALADAQFEGRAALPTWLYRVTVNVCLDALRRRKRWRWISRVLHSASSESTARTEAHAALAETAELLAGLPPEQVGALVLTQVEGHSNAEAAGLLGCSEGAVEQRLIRARAALRRRTEP
jgi:RNA polymerase sigma-70 factor (ECF subfamily)